VYDPVKSEETDNEDTNNISNNEQHLPIKEEYDEVKNEDISMDDNDNSEKKEVGLRTRKSPRLLANHHTTQPRRYRGKRKREAEEINGTIQKTARVECSVEGFTGKAADSGTCSTKHRGYKHCSQDGCTNQVQNRGVCVKHGAKVEICSHDGCTKHAKRGGFCVRHGAKQNAVMMDAPTKLRMEEFA